MTQCRHNVPVTVDVRQRRRLLVAGEWSASRPSQDRCSSFWDIRTAEVLRYQQRAALHGSQCHATEVVQSCKYYIRGGTAPHQTTARCSHSTPQIWLETVLCVLCHHDWSTPTHFCMADMQPTSTICRLCRAHWPVICQASRSSSAAEFR